MLLSLSQAHSVKGACSGWHLSLTMQQKITHQKVRTQRNNDIITIKMAKILVIEDEYQMAHALKDNFEMEGYDVKVANDGESGVKYALEGLSDIIILDVMLLKISGFDG